MNSLLNEDALKPLYKPWDEPNSHRVPNTLQGGPALIEAGRRPSKCLLVPRLRHAVDLWRHSDYLGASETTKTLLYHWFQTAHENDFRYHFCQREAIETIIYLYEVVGYRDLSSMYSSLFDEEADATFLKGITPTEDAWARYCCKIATGGGKTKVIAMTIVWSYFHRLYEPNSDLAQHFVVITPGLTVFERLKDDFAPGTGGKRIFESDPLLPSDWASDFDLQVVLQDDAGGATNRGALYLTNIHRLYEREKKSGVGGIYGPRVKKAQALKTGEALRKRITSHPTFMVLNDEAHHLHDLDSTWNEAITNLDKQCKQQGNIGICAQMDFTATPKHNDGALFKHIVCDFPLGEAVDAGIVKVPVIFRSDELKPRSFDNAAQKWEVFLKAGYKRYEFAYAEWSKSRKPILFVMTESAPAANEIAAALDSDDYPLLKGRVVNLHTRLKGKIKTINQGGKTIKVFEENEKEISDDDLKALREISRNLDAPDSKYRCVVSVMMLREGWDVRNVTTIVPLRPYSADSNILAEQTLGRGLRRMTPPGQTLERVTVVEHSAFVRLYEQELSNEGVIIGTEGNEAPTPISTTIFVDPKKPTTDLEIEIPYISSSIQVTPTLKNLTFEDVQARFGQKGYIPLPINGKKSGELVFEERALFTEELVASFKLDRSLLAFGIGAVSVFVKELERACSLQSAHATLAPLIQRFLEEVLFEQQVSLYSGNIDHRLGDTDVAEHVRAVFAPLIRERTITQTERKSESSIVRLSEWKPYQASSTPSRPCIPAEHTLFNLVPCTMGLEAEFVDFCDMASANDVAAFAKNAGPQKLMIDFQASNGRPAHYVPDFFVRLNSGHYCLVELKGQEDREVPLKARAAVEWCAAASTKQCKWEYVFVSQQVFESNYEFSMQALARACRPRLKDLLDGLKTGQLDLPLEETPDELKQERTDKALTEAGVFDLPDNIREYVGYAVAQLAYARRKNYTEFGSAFAPLLVPFEQLCGDIIRRCLGPFVPKDHSSRRYYFDPDLSSLELKYNNIVKKNQVYLQKLLVSGINTNRIGTLLFCLEYALEWETDLDCVWSDVVKAFSETEFEALLPVLRDMYFFRNKHIAHADELLTDGAAADAAMKRWVVGLSQLSKIATA